MIIHTRALFKTYNLGGPNEMEVLHGIDFDVPVGQFVAIIGQSGSGKSTLLNILGALDTKSSGSVEVDGIDLETLDSDGLAELRGNVIGFIFQAHFLLEEFSCLENALMPITIQKGTPSPDDTARVRALLTKVGLGDQLHKPPSQMSGGQQQRTAIIRALANNTRLILADEPTGNLDAKSGQQVFDLMRSMAKEAGVTFLMVTHDDRLARAADRILRIDDGTMQEVTM